MQSEVSQKEKNKYCVLTHTYGMDRQQGPTFKELHSVTHDKQIGKSFLR